MSKDQTTKNSNRLDLILLLCLLFDIVNVVLYLQSLVNYSFISTLTIFILGFVNVLFAILMYFRVKSNADTPNKANKAKGIHELIKLSSNYQDYYGAIGLSQAKYYMNTIWRGAIFIAGDFLVVFGILWLCLYFTSNVPSSLHHCSSSIEPFSNPDVIGFVQYTFDNYVCHSGNSQYLSFVSVTEDNFIVVVLNRLMSTHLSWGNWWILLLYTLLIVSIIPFIWILVRCVHCTFSIFKRKKLS